MFRLHYKIIESVVNPWGKKSVIWLDDDSENYLTFDTREEVREFIQEHSEANADALFVVLKLVQLKEDSCRVNAVLFEGGYAQDLICSLSEEWSCLG